MSQSTDAVFDLRRGITAGAKPAARWHGDPGLHCAPATSSVRSTWGLTGTSTGCMTSRRRSVPPVGAALFTLCDRSQPAAGRHADVSGRQHRVIVRHDSSMANRSIEGAAPDAAEVERRRTPTGSPITMPCVTRCRRHASVTATHCYGMATASARRSPGCLMANCLTSISALRAARVARQICVSDSRSVCRRRLSHATDGRFRAATSRATTANRAAHSRRADGDVSVALHAGSAAVCLSARKAPPTCSRCCARCLKPCSTGSRNDHASTPTCGAVGARRLDR